MNIAELTRQLREEIEKQYGVECRLSIGIHDHYEKNSHIERKSANQLALAMANVYGRDIEVEHKDRTGTYWVNIYPHYEERTSITIFYPEV